jgi:hypothetical protein
MNDTLFERILIAAVGPITAAVVGTLIIGLFVAGITQRAQDRRARYELRRELITQMTEASSTLLYATVHYRRLKQGIFGEDVHLNDILPILYEHYRKTRTTAKVLDARLEAYFESDAPRHYWHAAIDLLAVRYYHVLGQATDEVRESNAGPTHSGLTAEELQDLNRVIESYREMMRKATVAVLTEPLSQVTRRG